MSRALEAGIKNIIVILILIINILEIITITAIFISLILCQLVTSNQVCGSDGESYDNHCLLHRAACLSGKIIPRPASHPFFGTS